MIDFRVVSTKVLLNVSSIAPIRGFSPPAIAVIGTDLNLTESILYNGIEVKEFMVSSSTRMIVRIPQSQVGKNFSEIRVYSSVAKTGKDSLISLEIAKPIKNVSGIDRLVQSFMLVLLTNPGSDIFSPNSGGGVRAIVGRTTDHQGSGVAAALAQAIDRTKAELLRLQSTSANLPLAEKLLSCSLSSLSFDDTTSAINARVILQNMLGDQATVAVG